VVPTDGCHEAENDWRSFRGNEQEQRLMNGTCLYVNEVAGTYFNLYAAAPGIKAET
jgi:hypothetical protein